MSNFILLLTSVAFGATGQFLFRMGMRSYGQVSAFGAFRQIVSIVLTPSIFVGFALFGISSILWLSVISKYQLSYAYPMVSMGYVLTLILSQLFLNEQINTYRILGTCLIVSGVVFISKS
jgi:drug/metabolite transporter (DMT)-like permease